MLTPDKLLRPRCGDSITFLLVITRDAARMPLEGVKLTLSIKRAIGDSDAAAVLTKVSGGGITHLPAVGEARVDIAAEESRALGYAESYYWDVQGVDGGGKVFTPDGLVGRFRQLPDITKAVSQ